MKKDQFMEVCRKHSTEALTPQDEKFLGVIGQAIEDSMSLETTERSKAINEALEGLVGKFDEGEKVSEVVRKLAEKIDAVEKQGKRTLSNVDKFKLQKSLEAKKEEIIRGMKGEGNWSIEFHAKRAAASMMTTANVMTGSVTPQSENWFEDPEVVVIQYPKNFVLDAISSRLVGKVPETLIVKEQQPINGDATVTAEGVTKPLIQFIFAKTTYNRKKYAGRIELTEEVEIDFEQLVGQIIVMFEDQVLRVWQNGVLADILTYASSYVSTALDGTIPQPDTYAVIGAGIAHIQSMNYEPDILAINPVDVWAMNLTQDKNGQYKFNPLGNNFGGLTPLVSNGITAGNLLIGTKRTIKEQHGAFIVRKGVSGTQFIENEATIVGEVFSVLQTPTASKASWLYLDIETVKDALELELA